MTHQIENSSAEIECAEKKIVSLEEVAKKERNVILTKGVFDLLHAGHLSLFSYMKRIRVNEIIVIAVSSDRITRIKKGELRPIYPEMTRALQVALMGEVDYVILHDSLDYGHLLRTLQPLIYIKGMDTATNPIDPSDITKYNPELTSLPPDSKFVVYSDGGTMSTSATIAEITRRYCK